VLKNSYSGPASSVWPFLVDQRCSDFKCLAQRSSTDHYAKGAPMEFFNTIAPLQPLARTGFG
jgi:hypothetical protein